MKVRKSRMRLGWGKRFNIERKENVFLVYRWEGDEKKLMEWKELIAVSQPLLWQERERQRVWLVEPHQFSISDCWGCAKGPCRLAVNGGFSTTGNVHCSFSSSLRGGKRGRGLLGNFISRRTGGDVALHAAVPYSGAGQDRRWGRIAGYDLLMLMSRACLAVPPTPTMWRLIHYGEHWGQLDHGIAPLHFSLPFLSLFAAADVCEIFVSAGAFGVCVLGSWSRGPWY